MRDLFDYLKQELSQSSQKQETATKRLANLNDIVMRMEQDLLNYDRVRRENSFLDNERRDLKADLSRKSTLISNLEARLNDITQRYEDSQNNDALRKSELAALKDQQSGLRSKISDLEQGASRLLVQSNKDADKVTSLESRLTSLQNVLDDVTVQREDKARALAEKESEAGTLAEKLISLSKNHEAAHKSLRNVELARAQLEAQYVELKGQHETLRFEYEINYKVLNEQLLRRDTQIDSLKRREEHLDQQLSVSRDMTKHLEAECQQLRNSYVAERDKAASLDNRLREQADALERGAEAFSKSKQDFDDLNRRYFEALDENEALADKVAEQSRLLDRYAAISGKTALEKKIIADRPTYAEKPEEAVANLHKNGSAPAFAEDQHVQEFFTAGLESSPNVKILNPLRRTRPLAAAAPVDDQKTEEDAAQG